MSISRIGGGFSTPFPTSTPDTPKKPDQGVAADQAPPQDQYAPPGMHRHRHGHGLAKPRQLMRKKRDADNPHASDPNAESEELLMMLEQHLLRDGNQTQKVDVRDGRDQQQSSTSDQRDSSGLSQRHGDADVGSRKSATWTMRLVRRPARNDADLLAQWRAAGKSGTRTPLAQAEQALLALPASGRRAGAAGKNTPASPTYTILAIVREFLAIPQAERASPSTLAGVRDRLLAATPAGASGGVAGGVKRPPTPAQESVNLLLPIALLNLARHRTAEGRATGISALAALIRRGRGW